MTPSAEGVIGGVIAAGTTRPIPGAF